MSTEAPFELQSNPPHPFPLQEFNLGVTPMYFYDEILKSHFLFIVIAENYGSIIIKYNLNLQTIDDEYEMPNSNLILS